MSKITISWSDCSCLCLYFYCYSNYKQSINCDKAYILDCDIDNSQHPLHSPCELPSESFSFDTPHIMQTFCHLSTPPSFIYMTSNHGTLFRYSTFSTHELTPEMIYNWTIQHLKYIAYLQKHLLYNINTIWYLVHLYKMLQIWWFSPPPHGDWVGGYALTGLAEKSIILTWSHHQVSTVDSIICKYNQNFLSPLQFEMVIRGAPDSKIFNDKDSSSMRELCQWLPTAVLSTGSDK